MGKVRVRSTVRAKGRSKCREGTYRRLGLDPGLQIF
jgi:hypothetical protein